MSIDHLPSLGRELSIECLKNKTTECQNCFQILIEIAILTYPPSCKYLFRMEKQISYNWIHMTFNQGPAMSSVSARKISEGRCCLISPPALVQSLNLLSRIESILASSLALIKESVNKS